MRVLLLALALAANVDWTQSDCQEWADRSAVQPAHGVTRVVIIGRAGFLHVEGRAGATEIHATGRACAPIEHFLVGMLLKSSRSGSTVTIEATVPRGEQSLFASEAKLDFTVTVPAGMDVDVADTSGDLRISNVGNTRVADTTGDLVVSDIRGNFTLTSKRSGSVNYKRVSGRVSVPARYRK